MNSLQQSLEINQGLGPNTSRLFKVGFSKGGSVACWTASSVAAAAFGPLETIDIGDSVKANF